MVKRPENDLVQLKCRMYSSAETLLHGFKQGIIDRAWAKHQELVKQKNQALETQSIEGFVRKDEG